MERREPPTTAEGWYVLHSLWRIDWDAWRGAPAHERQQAIAEGVEHLRAHENLADADEGGSAVFSVLGHEADLLVVHMRPTTAAIDLAERRFERTALAGFTERADSYVSVTEVSGYSTDEIGPDGIGNVENEGLARYLRSRLYPDLPDAAHVCFYPMDKRRGPGDNWYDLPFEERADLMSSHAEIGREYAGDVTQIITGSVGLDDYEWGVTLLADDPTAIKHLLYEMRFDPSSSRFVEFGPFYFGRRFPPGDLDALLAGEPVPTDVGPGDEPTDGVTDDATDGATDVSNQAGGPTTRHGGDSATSGAGAGDTGAGAGEAGTGGAEAEGDRSASEHPDVSDGDPDVSEGEPERDAVPPDGPPADGESLHEPVDETVIRRELRGLGLRIGDHPEAGYALVFPSSADAENLVEDVDELRGNFEHYETHVLTTVRAEAGRSSVASLWANRRAADVASGFLADLSGVQPGVGGPVDPGEPGVGGPVDTEEPGVGGPADPEAGDGPDADGEEAGEVGAGPEGTLREELQEQGIYAGQPHGQDVYAMVVYSEAAPGDIADELESVREQFDADDSHVKTAVYRTEPEGGPSAVASLWESQEAAASAGGELVDLPGVVGRADEGDGFETMGLFYTVKPEFQADFRERFETVGDLLADMDGHRGTELLVNRTDETDMFIASRWDSKEDALAFFRSEAFRDTVQWGREVLADRPRHVFLT